MGGGPIGEFLHEVVSFLGSAAVYKVGASFLGFVFTWSAIAKTLNPRMAAQAFVDFGVSGSPRLWQAGALVAVEGFVGVTLLLHQLLLPSLLIATGLLALFSILVMKALISGKRFPCMCFGNKDATLSSISLARTASLLAISGSLAATHSDLLAIPLLSLNSSLSYVAAAGLLAVLVLLSNVRSLLTWNVETVSYFKRQAGPSGREIA